jgi:uncharacterized protein (TIGR04255 family)
MPKTYKNPPLLEAVCEFRFVSEGNYSAEQIASFYETIKGSFPVQKKGKINKVEFRIDTEKTPEENKGSISQDFYEFEQYFSEDEKYSIQLDGGRISIHRIKPYTAWSQFFPLIQTVYNAYIEVFKPTELSRVGVRYINEIVLPVDGFTFSDYFTLSASLPSLDEANRQSIFLGSVFGQEGGRDAIKVQFGDKQLPEETTSKAFVLDLDYFLVTATVTLDAVDEWLTTAHTNLENVFEGIVTEKTKQFFDK